ncbi:MAG: type transport system ATP-binding protein [Methanolobus sp.]|nr:type transport system ATP-binding protein [Methanolobus sp.]
MSIIEIDDLSKSYDGKVKVIDSLSMQLEPGKIGVLLGKNGAGKTTTIKILMGMLKFDEGDVRILDESIKADYPISLKKVIGYVPDSNTLYGYLTGYQYLRFICGIYGMDFKNSLEEIDEYVKLFQMENYMNKLIHTYSKGTVQKLMILGEFVHKPQIMIMDEPFSALDPEMIVTVLDLIRRKADEGCAFIISSHIINLVERVCDVYTIIKDGKVLAQGEAKLIKQGKSLEDVYFESVNSSVE